MRLVASGRTQFDGMLSMESLPDGKWLLDMSDCQFIDPYSLVGIACFVDLANSQEVVLRFRAPDEPKVLNYVSRMGLQEMLTKRYQWSASRLVPPVRAAPHENDLVELQWFDAHGVERLANFVWDRLDGKASAQAQATLWASLCEVAENVIFHAGTGGGWIAAQTYMRGTSSARVQVAIGDIGLGIRATMKRHAPKSDHHAIRLALEYGVSGLEDPARGIGLADTAEQVTGLGGVLMVRSGGGRRRLTARTSTGGAVPFLQGTIVTLSIPCA